MDVVSFPFEEGAGEFYEVKHFCCLLSQVFRFNERIQVAIRIVNKWGKISVSLPFIVFAFCFHGNQKKWSEDDAYLLLLTCNNEN